MSHRWSGWPGARCLDCGVGDVTEECLANCDHGVGNDGFPIIGCTQPPCSEPGSKRHDPYNAVLVGVPVRTVEIEDDEPLVVIKGEVK